MRKKIVAGNWKMNTSLEEGVKLAKEVNEFVTNFEDKEIGAAIAAPFTHLSEISKVIDTDAVCLVAQNCASEAKGAYTGEVSAEMIRQGWILEDSFVEDGLGKIHLLFEREINNEN